MARGELDGLAYALYPGTSRADARRAIAEIAGLGARAVSLVVHWHQRDVEATALRPGALTPRDTDVVDAIATAHAHGLDVVLFPIVWVEKRATGKWRGTLVPSDRGAWWLSYERFILHYAAIAEATDAAWLSVGSELGSTETWRGHWYHLISQVEAACGSRLLYSANWDHFALVSFWRRLDAVGINAYTPIAKTNDATSAAMAARWNRHARALTAAAKRVGKPLVLTEVGYLSRDGAAVKPWDYTRAARVDLEEQRRAYAAFSSVWRGQRALAGALFWNWNGDGGRRDTDYTPRGKPAQKVLERFFRARQSAIK